MYLKYLRTNKINFAKRADYRDWQEKCYIFNRNNTTIMLEGKFYYATDGKRQHALCNKDASRHLKNIIENISVEEINERLEGEYHGIWIDNKSRQLKIFSDKLKQKELYYFYNDEIFIASDDPKKIIDDIGDAQLEEQSLISAILLSVPKGHTFFKKIYRLKYNEIIRITESGILIEKLSDTDTHIAKYSDNDLSDYNEIVRNAIFSRASNDLNLVYCSGGWDSTIVLAILRERFKGNKLRGIIMKYVLADGRCFNQFEIAKASKICKTLGVKLDKIDINYNDKSLRYDYAIDRGLFFKNINYIWSARWHKTVEHISKNYGKDVVIFNGEGCDSLHNYGFSQYISLPHTNNNFREYADKMKNYLFSPEFFSKVKDNTFNDDSVYQIFRYFYSDKKFMNVSNFNANKKNFYYLLSFVYSDVRIPFRQLDSRGYIKSSALQNLEKWLEKEYFKEVVDGINEGNFYYYLSHLYTLFHLQSPQVRIFREGLNNARFPFIDLNLFNFLYKMPQGFGRGLDFNRIKFPLKELAKKILTSDQIKIIETGCHSYLNEIEKINIFDEYLLKGSIFGHLKESIDIRSASRFFSDDIFNAGMIGDLIKRFQQGKIESLSEIDAKFLIMSSLLSLGNIKK